MSLLPETHESFLEYQASNIQDKIVEVSRVLAQGVSEFIDYKRLENLMEKEVNPLLLELSTLRRNRQIQMLRDVYPDFEQANELVESLKTTQDSKEKYKKFHELLELYIQRGGDIRKQDVFQRFYRTYQTVVEAEKENLRDYLESNIFDSQFVQGEKVKNKEVKLVNRDAFLNMIQNARTMVEIKGIQLELDSIAKSFQKGREMARLNLKVLLK
ncbi:hypothetical protein [Erysipelothrix piscisicarius]|uniref:hypothetical protein n=1 Tax=Erysipelothrix piscisicarius TaxID=2485784 RepID=UPI002F91E33C